jgi:hypothetical protein
VGSCGFRCRGNGREQPRVGPRPLKSPGRPFGSDIAHTDKRTLLQVCLSWPGGIVGGPGCWWKGLGPLTVTMAGPDLLRVWYCIGIGDYPEDVNDIINTAYEMRAKCTFGLGQGGWNQYEVDFSGKAVESGALFQRNIITSTQRPIAFKLVDPGENGEPVPAPETVTSIRTSVPVTRWPFALQPRCTSLPILQSTRLQFPPEQRPPLDVQLLFYRARTTYGRVVPYRFWAKDLESLQDFPGLAMVRVGTKTDEYGFVADHFRHTVCSTDVHVHFVYRLQNPAAAEAFALERRRIEASRLHRDQSLDEKLVWHGVQDKNSIASIAADTFRASRAKRGVYGQGIYSAAHAATSMPYSSRLRLLGSRTQLGCLFLAHLVVGDKALSDDPPIKPGTAADRFETFVNSKDYPTIYCATRDHQMLPLYLVTYASQPLVEPAPESKAEPTGKDSQVEGKMPRGIRMSDIVSY